MTFYNYRRKQSILFCRHQQSLDCRKEMHVLFSLCLNEYNLMVEKENNCNISIKSKCIFPPLRYACVIILLFSWSQCLICFEYISNIRIQILLLLYLHLNATVLLPKHFFIIVYQIKITIKIVGLGSIQTFTFYS